MAQTVNREKNSMFYATPIYSVDGDLVYGLRRDSILPDSTDTAIDIVQANADQLAQLSYSLYGTPDFWWAIAELNHVVDPMTEIVAGITLRVPSKERLLAIINQ